METNGTKRTLVWVLGILVSVVVALGGFGIQYNQQAVGENRKGILELWNEVHEMGEKQAQMAVQIESIGKQVDILSNWHRGQYEQRKKMEWGE